MRMYDIILKKRNGGSLADEEIQGMIDGYVAGEIPDYQMSAMLMAIYFKGMDKREISSLTRAMACSGERVDLSAIQGVKVDKHSTGGVGDKTTLIIGPIVAACGGKVAKMSGRGLGHTGGTIDKLESIPGFKTSLSMREFYDVVDRVGVGVAAQSANLAPADKMLYALRDVTATVDSIALIAASVMSKKLAAGADRILLDVTCGSGAFMKTFDDAAELARTMVEIGEAAGKKTVALITDMDAPLGSAVGNSLEVVEAMRALEGKAAADLEAVCLELAANMLYLSDKGTLRECRAMAKQAIADGGALKKFSEMIEAQGGDAAVTADPGKLPKAPHFAVVRAERDGYITRMDAEACGAVSVALGAGRATKDAPIDFSAGIIMEKKTGDRVRCGDALAFLYTSRQEGLKYAEQLYRGALTFGSEKPRERPLILARIERGKMETYAK